MGSERPVHGSRRRRQHRPCREVVDCRCHGAGSGVDGRRDWRPGPRRGVEPGEDHPRRPGPGRQDYRVEWQGQGGRTAELRTASVDRPGMAQDAPRQCARRSGRAREGSDRHGRASRETTGRNGEWGRRGSRPSPSFGDWCAERGGRGRGGTHGRRSSGARGGPRGHRPGGARGCRRRRHVRPTARENHRGCQHSRPTAHDHERHSSAISVGQGQRDAGAECRSFALGQPDRSRGESLDPTLVPQHPTRQAIELARLHPDVPRVVTMSSKLNGSHHRSTFATTDAERPAVLDAAIVNRHPSGGPSATCGVAFQLRLDAATVATSRAGPEALHVPSQDMIMGMP